MSVITVHEEAGVALVTLNRPEANNALNRDLSEAIINTFTDLAESDSVRAIVLTGSGRAFCAGVDLKALTDEPELLSSGLGLGPSSPIVVALEQCRQPIIGAVNGAAVTGGFELALACDFLFASDQARFADTHARVGILPGWGLSQKLSRIIGINRAREMSLTGNFIDAHRAEAWGLVNRVCKPEQLVDEALACAAQMADSDPKAVFALKALMNDGVKQTLGDALELEGERGNAFAKTVDYSQMGERLAALRQRAAKQ
ncbi:MAG: enoyl-CoA hydratase [Gammaproteobacteria bacterium]|nr:enoyl-CoA hydratase [Gammaproteobacteria bacterium]